MGGENSGRRSSRSITKEMIDSIEDFIFAIDNNDSLWNQLNDETAKWLKDLKVQAWRRTEEQYETLQKRFDEERDRKCRK